MSQIDLNVTDYLHHLISAEKKLVNGHSKRYYGTRNSTGAIKRKLYDHEDGLPSPPSVSRRSNHSEHSFSEKDSDNDNDSDNSSDENQANSNDSSKSSSDSSDSDDTTTLQPSMSRQVATRQHTKKLPVPRNTKPSTQPGRVSTRNRGKRTVMYQDCDDSDNGEEKHSDDDDDDDNDENESDDDNDDDDEEETTVSSRGRVRRLTPRARASLTT